MKKTIGFIGLGNMGSAIIASIKDTDIYGYDMNSEKISELSNKYGVIKTDSIKALCEASELVFMAVKPQNFTEVLAEMKGHISQEKVIVSIAAGISSQFIKTELGVAVPIILVMPNTPLLLSCGATAIAKTDEVSDLDFDLVKSIFDKSGITAVVTEKQITDIIPINGSSPAFIYEMAKHFIDYGVSKGIDSETSKRLFSQALIGSAKMITDSGYDLDTLIQMVSSKGGTTIAGLDALRANGFEKSVSACCEACVNRAYEMKK